MMVDTVKVKVPFGINTVILGGIRYDADMFGFVSMPLGLARSICSSDRRYKMNDKDDSREKRSEDALIPAAEAIADAQIADAIETVQKEAIAEGKQAGTVMSITKTPLITGAASKSE